MLLFTFGAVNSFAQVDLADIDEQIQAIELQGQYRSLEESYYSGDSLYLYLSRTRLAINRETRKGVNFLINVDFEALNSPSQNSGYSEKLLKAYIHTKAKVNRLLEESNRVAKYAKWGSEKIGSSYETLTDRQIRLLHYHLSQVYAENNGLEGWEKIKESVNAEFKLAEQELQRRALFPATLVDKPNLGELLSRRTMLIDQINLHARQQAEQFVDNRATQFESVRNAQDKLLQIHEIDRSLGIAEDKLPSLRDLFSDFTVKQRILTLELAANKLDKDIAIKRHYALEALLLKDRILTAAEAEKKWYAKVKLHEAAMRTNPPRGPPFELPPFPNAPKPDGSVPDIPMDFFLDESRIGKINKKSRDAFEKTITREIDRFKAFNLDAAEIINLGTKSSGTQKPVAINDYASYITALQHEYYKTLSIDPVRAELARVEYDEAIKYFSSGKKPFRNTSFLENNPGALNQYLKDVRIVRNAKAKKITAQGDYAPPWSKIELEQLDRAISDLEKASERAKQRFSSNTRLEQLSNSGDIFSRPPPDIEAWITENDARLYKLDHEEFYLRVKREQQKTLEKQRVRYGGDVPPSVEKRLVANKSDQAVNEMSKILGVQRELAPHLSKIKAIDNSFGRNYASSEALQYASKYLEEGSSPRRIYDDIKLKQVALQNKIVDLHANLQNEKIRASIPDHLYKDYSDAKKAMPRSTTLRKNIDVDVANWRPNQDFAKLKAMKFNKDPGGIWLTPEGFVVEKVAPPAVNWTVIRGKDVGCDILDPSKEYTQWKLDQKGKEKICFPAENESISQPKKTQVKLWF